MTLKTTKLRNAISFALAAGSIVGTGTAFAQDAAPATDTAELDRIQVTGSRIPQAETETAQPIITVTRADIAQQGFSSVADILQNLTSAGSPAISRADALSGGEDVGGYFIDIRNLGANRTLVLVNGQRLGISTSGLQDLGQIPLSAIERIEVLKDGASSIYGSDAIAGVVNVITRRNFNGAEVNAYLGAFDEGESKQSYDFTIGASNDRGSVTLSAEYSKEDPVLGGDRWFSKYGNSGQNFPYSGWSLISQNGVWLGGNCSSGLCTVNPGMDPTDPNNYHSITPAERANSNAMMMVQTGIEKKSLFVSSQLDITDNLRAKADISYNNRSTTQQIAGYPGNYGFGLLSANSYFNPAPGADQYWFRRFWEVPRTTDNQLDTLRVSLGLEGTLNFGSKQWDWDVGFLSNENDNDKLNHGDAYVPALQASLGPSYFNTTTGRVECGTSANPIDYGSDRSLGQCIPFNPFLPYGQAGQGSLADPALQAFLFPEYHSTGNTKTTIYNANIVGSLATLPAGDLSLAVGVEHRKEEGRFVPDATIQSGQTTGNSSQITSGSYDVDEMYAELEIPVLADVTGAKELTVNLAGRYSDYSNFGSTMNPKFSLRWRPIDELLVRFTYADGFRAPAISDMFGGVGQSFEFYTDPCGATAPNSVNGNAACNAAGVPLGYVQLGQANVPCTTFPCQTNNPFLSGSNPNLSPETATSKTAGIVWSPRWVKGLDISLDWYDVEVEDVISSDSVDQILKDCYVNNIASRCASIVRGPLGDIQNMFFGLTNLGAIRTEGYDLGVKYRLPEFSFGQFNIDWQTSYTSKYDVLADNDPATQWQGNVGYPGLFRIRSNFGVGWELGDYSVAYMGRYYSGMKEACASAPRPCNDPTHIGLSGGAEPLNRSGSNTFHDLQFSVKLPWNASASVGANNITDHQGPLMFTAPNSNFPYYGGFDIGRFWYVKYSQKF